MDFARQQRDPTRHMVGIILVVLLHVLVIYGLVTGLARKAVQVLKKPLDATIIQEMKLPPPPPPPPKKTVEPPPKPPDYVPPPDIPVPVAVATGPTITAVTTHTPAPEPPKVEKPVVVAPPPPPPPPPKPAVRRGGQLEIIGREDLIFPKEAIRAGVERGTVVARMQIDENGHVVDVQIISSDPPRVFDKEVRRALSMWRFKADGERYVGEIEIGFKLE